MQVNEETCISFSSSKFGLYICTAKDSANATFLFCLDSLSEVAGQHALFDLPISMEISRGLRSICMCVLFALWGTFAIEESDTLSDIQEKVH